MRCLPALLLVVLLTGCRSDDRIRRLTSINEAKTETAKKEFTAAPNDAEKVKVADEYFRNADEIARTLNDYAQGRKPRKKPAEAEVIELKPVVKPD